MTSKEKLKRMILFTLEFVAIGIDMIHPVSYSFFIAINAIGYDLLYENKKINEIPKLQYLLGLIVIPIFVGWMLNSI